MAFRLMTAKTSFTSYRLYLSKSGTLRLGHMLIEKNIPNMSNNNWTEIYHDEKRDRLGLKFVPNQKDGTKKILSSHQTINKSVNILSQLRQLDINITKPRIIEDYEFEKDMLIINLSSLRQSNGTPAVDIDKKD